MRVDRRWRTIAQPRQRSLQRPCAGKAHALGEQRRRVVDQQVHELLIGQCREHRRRAGRAVDDHAERRVDADRAWQPLGAAGTGNEAELHLGEGERCARGRHAIVAAKRELEPSTHDGTIERRHHRLLTPLDLADEAAQMRLLHRQRRAELGDVGAGREHRSTADEHNGQHSFAALGVPDGFRNGATGGSTQCIDRWMIDHDHRNAVELFHRHGHVQSGTTAIACSSIRARGSTSALTSTAAIAG
jgi:hypothetical protein